MNLWDEFERRLKRWLIIGLSLLVMAQGFMINDNIRYFLSIEERMEGRDIAALKVNPESKQTVTDQLNDQGQLIITVLDQIPSDKVKVIINDKTCGYFSKGTARIKVTAGDIVEIDTTAYDYPINFMIQHISPNVIYPIEKAEFTCHNQRYRLGKVELR